jgi:hypothetical protein
MNAAETIRDAVARVAALRVLSKSSPGLLAAVTSVKSLQARRFSGTYRDLLATREYGAAAQFFLVELYSEKDYSQRDAQFARIAGALQRIFPDQVVGTAVALAQLHVLTEEFDYAMAEVWLMSTSTAGTEIDRYLSAWQSIGRPEDRATQLRLVIQIGSELERLTRTPGLRLMLRMMRRPAMATGLGALQSFLEAGFDTFAGMSAQRGRATKFLEMIREREATLMTQLFANETAIGRDALTSHLRIE